MVLLHGLTAAADLNWFGVFDGLAAAGFGVVSVEHRGYRRGAPLTGNCRLEDLADDVVAVADGMGVGRFVVLGYSMGGAVAQLVWRRHRDRVAGLVLAATAAEFAVSARERMSSATLPVAALGARVVPAVARRFVGGTLRRRFAGSPWAGWADAELARHRPSVMLRWAVALGRFSSMAWVGEVDVPTAVVVMSRDVLVPTARQLALAATIPGAAVVRVEGDHGVFVTDPQAFSAALVEACRLVSPGPPDGALPNR